LSKVSLFFVRKKDLGDSFIN